MSVEVRCRSRYVSVPANVRQRCAQSDRILITDSSVLGCSNDDEGSPWWETIQCYALPVTVGVGAVAAAPFALGAVGFTGAGVAAGSMAANMMSAAAVANGGGVAAGSVVAFLQSAGVAGLGAVGNTVLAVTAATTAKFVRGDCDKTKDNE